ncbi:MAG: M6 family metalloprotease domain-containing protein [Paludibacteraceae bacterium]
MKKNLICCYSLLCICGMLLAVPAQRNVVSVQQPDGTMLQVRLHGDEYFHYVTTADGYLIQKNTAGVYEYGIVDMAADTIRLSGVKAHTNNRRTTAECRFLTSLDQHAVSAYAARHNRQSRAKNTLTTYGVAKTVGYAQNVPKGLIILVDLDDCAHTKGASAKDYFMDMMNKEGFADNGATGSVHDYFAASSHNVYKPQFEVVGPFKVSRKTAEYAGKNGWDYVYQMVNEACSLAYESGVSFADYDLNGDKVVDYVYVIYAGYSAAQHAENAIWPHSATLSMFNVNEANRTYGGYTIDLYACGSELDGHTGRDMAGIGTFCHEFSHVIGMPDYYDTQDDDNDETVGRWNIMDYGCYNNDGKTPPLYSAYDRFYMGWMTPKIMNANEDVTLESLATSNTARLVTTDGTMPATATTTKDMWFFENRQQTGWDTYLPGHGLLVTKVQYNQNAWYSNVVNSESKLRFDIQEAAGKKSFFGNDSDPFPGTGNITSYVPVGAYDLTDIQEKAGVVSFKFMGGAECRYRNECLTEHCYIMYETTCTNEGDTYTLKLCPDFGYELLPDEDHFAIMMGSDYLTIGKDCSFADSVLTIPYVKGKVEVYAVATAQNVDGQVALHYDVIEGVTPDNGTFEDRYIATNEPLVETWVAADCFETLTDDNVLVEVKVGDKEIESAYTVADGRLTITLQSQRLTDNVSISILATAQPTVYFDGEHCTLDGAECVGRGERYSATIVAESGYHLTADNVIITMDDDDLEVGEDFTFHDGRLVIRKVDGDIEIVAIAMSMPSGVPSEQVSQPVATVCGDMLHLDYLPAHAHIVLYDAVGRVLLSTCASASVMSCPLSSAGIYLVQIQCGSDVTMLKIIR